MTSKFNDLEALSLALEEATGYDSIDTVSHYMTDDDGLIKCVFPGCDKTKNTPIAMWRHIHFSSTHSRAFGVAWAGTSWKARLWAIAEGEISLDQALREAERPKNHSGGTPGTPKSSERHTDEH